MIYLDTSALIKRYLPERNSERFDAYFTANTPAVISRLTFVEVRSALGRKRREGRLNLEQEHAAIQEMRTDIQDGVIAVQPMTDADFIGAYHLMDKFPALPLRGLDALHLAVARAMGAHEIATADDVMRRTGETLGLSVAFFGETH